MLFDGFAPWRDPTITEINRLAMRPALDASDSLNDARARRASRRTRLDGAWRFKLFEQPESVGESALRGKSSALGRAWRTITVPGNWTMQDVGDHPHYTNIDMPFEGPPPKPAEAQPDWCVSPLVQRARIVALATSRAARRRCRQRAPHLCEP